MRRRLVPVAMPSVVDFRRAVLVASIAATFVEWVRLEGAGP